jgi:hypothetical protein
VLDTWKPCAGHLVTWGGVVELQQDHAAPISPPWPHSFTHSHGEHEVATAITIADLELTLERHSLTTTPLFNPPRPQLRLGHHHLLHLFLELSESRYSHIADFSTPRAHRSATTLAVLHGQSFTARLRPIPPSFHPSGVL